MGAAYVGFSYKVLEHVPVERQHRAARCGCPRWSCRRAGRSHSMLHLATRAGRENVARHHRRVVVRYQDVIEAQVWDALSIEPMLIRRSVTVSASRSLQRRIVSANPSISVPQKYPRERSGSGSRRAAAPPQHGGRRRAPSVSADGHNDRGGPGTLERVPRDRADPEAEPRQVVHGTLSRLVMTRYARRTAQATPHRPRASAPRALLPLGVARRAWRVSERRSRPSGRSRRSSERLMAVTRWVGGRYQARTTRSAGFCRGVYSSFRPPPTPNQSHR